MPYYESIDELYDAVDEKLNTILEKDVAPIVEDILRQFIRKDIYEAYTPKPGRWVSGSTYDRRYDLEGSVYSIVSGDNSLLVTSNATASKPVVKGSVFRHRRPGAFLELLESGNMGIWRSGFARPAVSNAQENIKNNSRVQMAIKVGLDVEFS